MSRTLALLLLTTLLSAPALARADVRLTSDVMRLSLQGSVPGDEPLARRVLDAPAGQEDTRFILPLSVNARVWRFVVKVKQPTLAQAVQLGLRDPPQHEDALVSSVPAGTVSRGPAAVRSRFWRLPRLRF